MNEKEILIKLIDLSNAKAQELHDFAVREYEHLNVWTPAFLKEVETVEKAKEFLDYTMMQSFKKRGGFWGIYEESNLEKLLGAIFFNSIHPINKCASFGFFVGSQDSGRGIATAAVTEFLQKKLKRFDLNRIEMNIATQNTASLAVARKLGFVDEGCLRQSALLHGKFIDQYVFSMLSAEWLLK